MAEPVTVGNWLWKKFGNLKIYFEELAQKRLVEHNGLSTKEEMMGIIWKERETELKIQNFLITIENVQQLILYITQIIPYFVKNEKGNLLLDRQKAKEALNQFQLLTLDYTEYVLSKEVEEKLISYSECLCTIYKKTETQ